MKRLINTQLLTLLNLKGTPNPADTDLMPMYDDFVHSAVSICTSAQADVPAYFTLHYTRLELEAFQSKLSNEGVEKKCVANTVHRSLPCIYTHLRAMGRA